MKNSYRWLVFGLVFVLTLLALGAAYTYQRNATRPDRSLQTYGMQELDSLAEDGSHIPITKPHKVGAFTLTDQDGHPFTREQLRDKIYVADFFFTTCESICIPMGRSMEKLSQDFKDDPNVLFVSHTVDPETDSVPVLKKYATEHHYIPGKWFFLTGPKKTIYDLARHEYFVTATEGDGGPDDFVHTQNFALVDPHGQIRGYYDGTQENEMRNLARDIKILEQEAE